MREDDDENDDWVDDEDDDWSDEDDYWSDDDDDDDDDVDLQVAPRDFDDKVSEWLFNFVFRVDLFHATLMIDYSMQEFYWSFY